MTEFDPDPYEDIPQLQELARFQRRQAIGHEATKAFEACGCICFLLIALAILLAIAIWGC